jgi:PAS domain S-box-containing protein
MNFENTHLTVLHGIIEEIEDYAVISLDLSGHVKTWNKGAHKIKGYPEAEIIGKHFSLFYNETDIRSDLPNELIRTALLEGKAGHEGWRVRKDGSSFWGLVTITALHNGQDVVGFLKMTRDLTDRITAENTIKEQLAQLEFKNKELEQFVYIASHDLQEPLLNIMNFIELIEQEMPDQASDTFKWYLDIIAKSGIRMRKLIKGLLDYSRIGAAAVPARVDCMKILEEIKADLHTTINDSDAVLHYEDLPVVAGYATPLRQLFQNLISNAIKFRNPHIAPSIRIKAVSQKHQWEFSVSDNGIGFDPEFKDKIFLIFQRLHNQAQYEGNGIGLANCKKIVELHGGQLSADSVPDQGSTFKFTIPFLLPATSYEKV